VLGEEEIDRRRDLVDLAGSHRNGGWPGRRWPRCLQLAWATAASLMAWATAASPLTGAGRPAGRRATPRTRLLLYLLLRTRLLFNFL
jgi:hypothetical protein